MVAFLKKTLTHQGGKNERRSNNEQIRNNEGE